MRLILRSKGVIGCVAATGIVRAGGPRFELSYLPRMVYYIIGAFPQQFVMCSVGLVTLAKLPVFRGLWRLPLAVGLAFCLAHFALLENHCQNCRGNWQSCFLLAFPRHVAFSNSGAYSRLPHFMRPFTFFFPVGPVWP